MFDPEEEDYMYFPVVLENQPTRTIREGDKAAPRIAALMAANWDLERFPFSPENFIRGLKMQSSCSSRVAYALGAYTAIVLFGEGYDTSI